MKTIRKLVAIILFSLAVAPDPCVFASVAITVGTGSGAPSESIEIPVTVDNPAGVAGAAFTIVFDGTALSLDEIQSGFFDTFANQWTALNPVPDPVPPSSVVVDSVTYARPVVTQLKEGIGMVVAAARCEAETENIEKSIFLLRFALKNGADIGTYPVKIVPTVLDSENAGYTEPTEIPMLIGIDAEKPISDPDAYFAIQTSVLDGAVTFTAIDSDGDGFADDSDAFPDNPNEWLDTDGDGTGNNTDLDDDDDGMPDEWENRYGLDPLADDANDDPDNDGYTNIQEYQNGTDPAKDQSGMKTAMPWIPLLLLGD